MSQTVANEKHKFDRNVNIEDILKTTDDSEIGYFIEIDLS